MKVVKKTNFVATQFNTNYKLSEEVYKIKHQHK